MMNFFKRHAFIFFLLIVVLLSYGQLLGMYVWQDDNALFFKLAHIEERAGYLGEGPFGIGPYKYTVTPYIPIHWVFGFNTIPYFVLTFSIYFLTTVILYKVFTKVMGNSGGKIVAFLYASGYIASDGFIRLFNSVITSVSVILISLMFFSYWNFFKKKKQIWYFLALALFFLANEFASARTHYLISIVFLFELLFLMFEKPIKSIILSFIRLTPFTLIFYHYFIVSPDQRSDQVKTLFEGFLQGDLYKSYSLITSFVNVVLPDWFTRFLLNINIQLITWLSLGLTFLVIILLLRKHYFKKIFIPLFILGLLVWKFIINDLYSNEILNLGQDKLVIILLGGEILAMLIATFFVIKDYKRIYVFFVSWIILNIFVYAAYNPTVSYDSVNRYLAHSFFAWIVVLAIFYLSIKNLFWKKITLLLIILLGIGNLSTSIKYQHQILQERSNPARNFYTQLKKSLPTINKGDVLYFDVADDAKSFYREAFSVAQMPETTAIAWRYGVDRYDIDRFTDFKDFAQFIKSKNIPPEKIYTFWYSDSGLLDNSKTVRELLFQGGAAKNIDFVQEGNVITLTQPLISTVPVGLTIRLQSSAMDPSTIEFPYKDPSTVSTTPIHTDRVLQQRAFAYAKAKDAVIKTAEYQTSSEWRERKRENLHDGDLNSIWQADRVLWQKHNEYITIDLDQPQMIDRFVWVNGFANNTPTKYRVEASTNGVDWITVASHDGIQRIDTKAPQTISFQSHIARYWRFVITETLGGDSPAIAEAWVVPVRVGTINITDAEVFLQHPFSFVATKNDFENLLVQLGQTGFVQFWWQSDKHLDWQTQSSQKLNVRFDGKEQEITTILPAGGTKITKLKLSDLTIPGTVVVNKITARSLPLDELPF